MKQVLLLLPFLFFGSSSHACLNEYGHTLKGHKLVTRYFYLAKGDLSFNKSTLTERLKELRALDSHDFRNQSDIAVVLMKLGKTDSALAILQPLIELHPNEYKLNSNIGTAYELAGDLENALKYIKNGHRINPNAHYKSEWIHVKILEAKIKTKTNPTWLRTHPIITIDELLAHMKGRDMHPNYRHNYNQLAYQIKTRVPFTPAPNAVIANLTLTLGEFSEKHGIYENALMAYIYTMEFRIKLRYATDIYTKIRHLNRSRESLGIEELPRQFKDMLRVASMDPDLLVAAISGFEEREYSNDSIIAFYDDSLTTLQDELSLALKENDKKKASKTNTTAQSEGSTSYGFIALLALGGIVFGFVVAQMLRKPERK